MTALSEPNYGIVIAGHGSRDPDGISEFETMIQILKQRCPERKMTHGFLEFSRPTIDEAIRANIQLGSQRIVMVPGVLLAATHAKNDMPSELLAMQREFPNIDLHYGAALELHPALLIACQERIIEAEAQTKTMKRRSEACLVVVGRGTTDSDANSQVSKLARMLEEGMGFGCSFVCYSGTAKPGIADGLKLAAKLGFSRLVVIPFFLFTGVLIKRIYASVDDLQRSFPNLEVLKCHYLGTHPAVADVLLERAAEGILGKAAMNCSMCKYRTHIIGYEKEVGKPQQGHHFHVRATNDQYPLSSSNSAHEAAPQTYEPHPIETQSFQIIDSSRDWSNFSDINRSVLQRLVHTSGDFEIIEDIFISSGALETGVHALQKGACLVTDVTMVQSGLKRALLDQLRIKVFCGVHDEESRLMAKSFKITRSAAGIRRAWEKFGNHVVVAIGDAPTAVEEALRLVKEHQWRPHLIIGLPVGFVGTVECKENLRRCLNIPRVTNKGTRGGSPWAAAVVNALMIHCANQVAQKV